MIDDTLRGLEHATRTSPDDAALARRYRYALERTGDRRGAYLELLRLARRGDGGARVELAALGALLPGGVRATEVEPITAAATETDALFGFTTFPGVIAATDRVLFVCTFAELCGIDTRTLRELWRVPIFLMDQIALSGPHVVLGRERELVLLDAETGVAVAVARMPGRIDAVAVEHDRAVALVVPEGDRFGFLAGLDLGTAFGRILWRRPAADLDLDLVDRIRCEDGFVLDRASRVAFRLEDGAPDDERARFAREHRPRLSFPTPERLVGAKRIEVGGSTFWVTQGRPRSARGGREETEVLVGATDPTPLAALPTLRSPRRPDVRFFRRVKVLAAARSVLYIASAGCPVVRWYGAEVVSEEAELANLVAIDATTGEVLLDRNIEADMNGKKHELEVVTLERAVLLTVATPTRLDVTRFGLDREHTPIARMSDPSLRVARVPEQHPHDHLFRSVFSIAENALAITSAVLPPAVNAALDPASLRLEAGGFVDDELRGQESDLLFSAKLDGREVKLFLLLEHQSTVDPLMPLRLLRYVVRVWERELRERRTSRRRIPAVIPMVLYHGPHPWSGPRRLAELIELPDALKAALGPHLPASEILIDDLAALDPADVERRQAGVLGRLALLFMKEAMEGGDLVELWRRVKPLVEQFPDRSSMRAGSKLLLSYTLSVREITEEALGVAIRQVLPGPIGDEIMATTAEKLIAEGERRVLVRLLEKKFGPLPAAMGERIAAADLGDLERWTERLLDAKRLEAVFSPGSKRPRRRK